MLTDVVSVADMLIEGGETVAVMVLMLDAVEVKNRVTASTNVVGVVMVFSDVDMLVVVLNNVFGRVVVVVMDTSKLKAV